MENRLTNFNNGAVIIAYNGDGVRVMKIVGTTTNYYLVDDRNPRGYAQVVEEYQALKRLPGEKQDVALVDVKLPGTLQRLNKG